MGNYTLSPEVAIELLKVFGKILGEPDHKNIPDETKKRENPSTDSQVLVIAVLATIAAVSLLLGFIFFVFKYVL